MARTFRNTLAILALVAGVVWSLPMQTGRSDAAPGPANYSAADPATFDITAFRSTLTLTGHTASRQHEQHLIATAAKWFPSHSSQPVFRALGVAPPWWHDATVGLLQSLATMGSASARLEEDSLRIRALVTSRPAAELQLRPLLDILPPSTIVDMQITEMETGMAIATLCERQFAALEPGPVGFEESGTKLSASAYPVLDRVIVLADACRDARISITGHTDSTGNETWNQHLSLSRAQTVVAHLAARGIAENRLIAIGAGSSLPIADNATRHGRGINRRIDIFFSSTR